MTDPLLTGRQAAQRCGLAVSTWRSYVHYGYAPDPDDPGRHPRWYASTVDHFMANRRGSGTRTDLSHSAEPRTQRIARRRVHRARFDMSPCPDRADCARFLHPRLLDGPCDCCGEMIGDTMPV